MVYFTERTQKFLADLEVNNNRDWFAANKEIFKVHVEQPFEKFVTDLIEQMKAFFPNMEITAKESIFRIYRDVRFGKDKSPYKIHMSAIISPGGRKDFRNPGFYQIPKSWIKSSQIKNLNLHLEKYVAHEIKCCPKI